MASTNTPNKGYELQTTGENQGTWGVLLNNNVFAVVDLNMGGRLAKTINSANVELTTDEAQNVFIALTGVLTGNRDLIFPANMGGFYFILNNTTGAFNVTVRPSGGTGQVAQRNRVTPFFINPTDNYAYYVAAPHVPTTDGSIFYQGPSGVEALVAPDQGSVLYYGGSDAPVWLGPGTAGHVLRSGGTDANPSWVAGGGSAQASFRATNSGQTLNSTGSTKLDFDESFDVGGLFANSVWTPPAGIVMMTAQIDISGSFGSASNVQLQLYKNGVTYRAVSLNPTTAFGTSVVSLTISSLEQVTGSDTFHIQLFQNAQPKIASGIFFGTMV